MTFIFDPGSSSGGAGSVTVNLVNNNPNVFPNAYPKNMDGKAILVPDKQMSILETVQTSFTTIPTGITPVIQTIGTTAINSWNQTVDANLAFGGRLTSEVWQSSQLYIAWNGNKGSTYAGTFDGTVTARIWMTESLAAGQNVCGRVQFKPLLEMGSFQASNFWTSPLKTPYTLNVTNFQISVNLMNASWVMTNIATTTNVASTETTGLITQTRDTKNILLPLIDESFTATASSLGDRIVIEVLCTIQVVYGTPLSGSFWGTADPHGAKIHFGYAGSDKSLSKIEAFRPIQIKIN